MCSRYTLRVKMNLLLDQFAAELAEEIDHIPRYNIAPSQQVLAVRQNEGTAKRELVALKWGLIPSWAKDAKIAYSTINARADSVATKPAFRAAYKKRRCLVLADGYIEWKKEGKLRLPYFYEVDGGKPFAFAGLWEFWRELGGEEKGIESCTMLTTEANELASQIHDRMPVILDPGDYDVWLAGEQIPLVPFADDRMRVRPVSTFVNNVKNSGPQCLEAPGSPLPSQPSLKT